MTLTERALAWLSRQWIEPELSRFIHDAIAGVPASDGTCQSCGQIVVSPNDLIEESDVAEVEATIIAVSGPASEPSGVTSSPSPGPIPSPAAVERRGDEVPEAMKGPVVSQPGYPLPYPERLRMAMQPKKLTIETRDGIVDVTKLDGENP